MITQRLAGHNESVVAHVCREIARSVSELHESKLVHSDLKLRNILVSNEEGSGCEVNEDSRVVLCDLDASGKMGSSRSIEAKAGSSGYYAPEVARWLVSQKQKHEIELSYEASQDVWSFGSVLFELCTGRNLFPLDLNDDSMVEEEDLTRLCAWSCLDDKALDGVFKNCETCDPETRAQAQHLIRWCLQGDPSDRPSFEKILQHPFLSQSFGVVESTKEDEVEEKDEEPVKKRTIPQQKFASLAQC